MTGFVRRRLGFLHRISPMTLDFGSRVRDDKAGAARCGLPRLPVIRFRSYAPLRRLSIAAR